MTAALDLPGTPFFQYQNNNLLAESVPVFDLAAQYGTPLFIYSQTALTHALSEYKKGFSGRNVGIHYAVKANSNLSILQFFAQHGCGFDTVSAGEIKRVLAAGGKASDIVFSGVGKTREEMRFALTIGIHCFNVESEAELATLHEVAEQMQLCAPISLRINPDVDAQTHPYISTGLKNNKFGISHAHALAVYKRAANLPWLKVIGIDCHIGSQIISETPFLDALDKLLELAGEVERSGIALKHIDCGGGLGIHYQNETPPKPSLLWQKMFALAEKHGYANHRFLIEPGRSLVGNAGICVTKALYLKSNEDTNYCIVDAAMNELPRPAMYDAYHYITPVRITSNQPQLFDVVGPVCESGDWLGKRRKLAISQGDLLAICSAGAYCSSMASNYNSRPLSTEILVHGEAHRIIRQRQEIESFIAHEKDLLCKTIS